MSKGYVLVENLVNALDGKQTEQHTKDRQVVEGKTLLDHFMAGLGQPKTKEFVPPGIHTWEQLDATRKAIAAGELSQEFSQLVQNAVTSNPQNAATAITDLGQGFEERLAQLSQKGNKLAGALLKSTKAKKQWTAEGPELKTKGAQP